MHLQSIFGRLSRVSRASLFPPNRQESLVIEFDTAAYPESIDAVRLEVRAYTNGDFHVSYLETHIGELRQCRFDCHEQDHNSRDHYHPLPDASTGDAQDREFPTDLTTVIRDVILPWVETRFGDLWDDA
ncbi:Uncharacterized protein SVXHr_0478 [Halorhabdus sp. SVX81]|nr:Uncharacterized protein SVXHr_0478 [Halorhabdus sp. SVX81]